ncbi:hypothetical protein DFQ30_000700 [Apophysomyces sp. BC1015]|nr:hypothetical protein DFQ30_000700 [Apophysomyces sp. BC1015]
MGTPGAIAPSVHRVRARIVARRAGDVADRAEIPCHQALRRLGDHSHGDVDLVAHQVLDAVLEHHVIEAERERAGITPREFTDEEIRIALRPLDLDVVLVHGYGFPSYRGGPMHYADTLGLANVLADIREFARQDPLFWQPSPLLVELASTSMTFSSLNRGADA